MSEKSDDYVSFEKALRDLKLRSEELKKLVSEGEIRAYKDGGSMKFRREDVDALSAKAKGEEELSFADSLEDDSGMVTEQLSDEDTLLAEEDEPAAKPKRGPTRPAREPAAVGAVEHEPGWVTAIGVLGFLVLVWGFMITYNISQESNPADSSFTSVFAQDKKPK